MSKKLNKICKVLIIVFSFMIIPISSWAATYYVSKNGDDANSGIYSSPWRTIGKANANLQPGDTVYIREGTYEETIRPNNSGSEGNPITYAQYENEEVTITNVYDGVDLAHRNYITIDGLRIINVTGRWVNISADDANHAQHNVIKNCYMNGADDYSGINLKNTHYNIIRNNELWGKCGPDDLISFWGSGKYNLIENNEFYYGNHVSVALRGRGYTTSYNVIRNNYFWNPWHATLSIYHNANLNLIEGNRIYDAGDNHNNNTCGSDRDQNMERFQHNGLQIGSSDLIVRNNVLVNNGRLAIESYDPDKTSTNNHIYNNTFYKNYRGINTNGRSGEDLYGCKIKNNIFYQQRQYEIIGGYSSGIGNEFLYNNILGGTVDYHSKDSAHDNLTVDPQFINEVADPNVKNSDLHLQSGSPMIDAGDFLTTTTSAGSGTSIPINDARYFMDGWGIIEGDKIQLEGQPTSVEILYIDYANNEITVDEPLSWKNGDGVTLAYKGNAPDIGAYEYGLDYDNDQSMSSVPENLRIKK